MNIKVSENVFWKVSKYSSTGKLEGCISVWEVLPNLPALANGRCPNLSALTNLDTFPDCTPSRTDLCYFTL